MKDKIFKIIAFAILALSLTLIECAIPNYLGEDITIVEFNILLGIKFITFLLISKE